MLHVNTYTITPAVSEQHHKRSKAYERKIHHLRSYMDYGWSPFTVISVYYGRVQ